MTAKKSPKPTKRAARKSTAKKVAAKKSRAKKAGAKKSPVRKSAAKKTAKKSVAKKMSAKKSAPKKIAPKKSAPRKSSAKKSSTKKSTTKKAAAKKILSTLATPFTTAATKVRSFAKRAKAFGVQPASIPVLPTIITADPPVGFSKISADKLGDGFGATSLRSDLKSEYDDARAVIKALGGVLTSSGAVRDLGEPATPGRSQTSFHYTGRAFDVWIGTGMQGTKDRYLVQRNGGSDALPEWEILCISENPDASSPLFDASLLTTGEVEFIVWKKGVGITLQKRTVTFFSLTSVLKKFGWVNIPARTAWKTEYLSCEWWHFQHHKGLVEGKSLFGDELRAVWKSALVAKSGLALGAVFKGRSFRIV